jgi:hypothetical protein
MQSEEKIPNKLYKYLPFDESYILDTLENGEFLFRSANYFNDPFELNPALKTLKLDEIPNFSKQLLKRNNIDRKHTKKLKNKLEVKGNQKIFWEKFIREHRKNIYIFCLSKTPYNLNLWAHYSESHKGVCFEIKLDSNMKYITHEVDYVETRPEFSLKKKDDVKNFENLYTKKSKIFDKEEEYRVIDARTFEESKTSFHLPFINFKTTHTENGKLISPFKITKMYLGANFNMDSILYKKAEEICKRKNISIIKYDVDDKKFQLNEIKIL